MLSVCIGVAVLTLHYCNGFMMSTNVITGCPTTSTATLKYKNTSTLLFIITIAVGVKLLCVLIAAVCCAVWFAGKDLSDLRASKHKPWLFLGFSLALLVNIVSAGYYIAFLLDYRQFSCSSNVQTACLAQAILLAIGVVTLSTCTMVVLSISKIKPRKTIGKSNPRPNSKVAATPSKFEGRFTNVLKELKEFE